MLPHLARPELAATVIKAVVFDFDGTLTLPGALDFGAIRSAIGCPAGTSILAFIEAIEDEDARAEAHRVLSEWERRAADESAPNEGAEELIAQLRAEGYPVAIQTRNTLDSVRRSLARFTGVEEGSFRIVIARDSGVPAKPDPAGIRLAAAEMGVEPESILVIGDYLYEIEAADAAGSLSVLLVEDGISSPHPPRELERAAELAAYTVGSLQEVATILRLHRSLPQGKVPNDMLADMIGASEDPSVIVGPAPGEDVAVVRHGGAPLLAVKSDPVTFATDRPGYYTVTVNANDIATSGARPRWMTTTMLFPPGTTPASVRDLLSDVRSVAESAGILVVGGHTEITDAVTRPVVSGAVIGTVAEDRVLHKAAAQAGDRIVVTKSAGLEGTAILAADAAERLRDAGLDQAVLDEASRLAGELSIVPEARVAADMDGARCLHDVTEGGIATAIEELSIASGRELTVDLDAVPVLESTRAVCDALGLDPLGLIGSGALLICIAADASAGLVAELAQADIPAAEIGWVGRKADSLPYVSAVRGGEPAQWPRFQTDELARYYEG